MAPKERQLRMIDGDELEEVEVGGGVEIEGGVMKRSSSRNGPARTASRFQSEL